MKLNVNYHVACVQCGFYFQNILVIHSAVPHFCTVSVSLHVLLLVVKILPLYIFIAMTHFLSPFLSSCLLNENA